MNYKLIIICALIVLLNACSSRNRVTESELPPLPTEDVESENEVETDGETEVQSLADPAVLALLNSENKYLLNKQSISSQQRALLEKAITQLDENNNEAALLSIEQAKQLGPLNSPSLVVSADIHLTLEQPEDAINNLQQALIVNPYNPKALNRMAKIKRQQGLFSEALAFYDRAIESVPADGISYRNRGTLLDLYLNEKALAMQDYQTHLLLLEEQQRADSNQSTDQSVNKQLTREIRLVKVWLNDLQRQIDTLEAQ